MSFDMDILIRNRKEMLRVNEAVPRLFQSITEYMGIENYMLLRVTLCLEVLHKRYSEIIVSEPFN